MLEVHDLALGYEGRPLLKEISFRLEAQTLTVLLGPNGCGKTTLLKTMARLLAPSQGQVLLDGKPMQAYGSKELARRLTLLPQTRITPELLVEDLVSQGRFPHRGYFSRPSTRDQHIVEESLQRCDLLEMRQRRVTTLSGGERQRVYLAMALAQDTKIILLDEPTAFLDIAQQLEVLELLRELCRQGKTLLVVLHDLQLALRYADRVLLLSEGYLQANATPQEILEANLVERVFNVNVHRFCIKQHGEAQIFTGFSRL